MPGGKARLASFTLRRDQAIKPMLEIIKKRKDGENVRMPKIVYVNKSFPIMLERRDKGWGYIAVPAYKGSLAEAK
eukprot:984159-Pelagomonas_calceolata.AAC.1